ncbi:HU family DNA-binding protein [Prevotella aurantiaca]|uniref:HU family DNA-binding protein n=1 Tax=Prevotella aurantiaca TaxID=596085 RepID=A0A930HKP7_9BACT|nr:HU family DNA-binding protein [Prevotella aurantiaca]MBF1383582.1 HU family DNA-binding protein [Prevotella aurantiaca]
MAKTALQLIADAVAKKHKITVKEAEKFVSAMFDVVNEGLKNDKLVKVKGLGTFKVQAVKPRESVNVNTGERVLIEGHDKVSFTPDASMKELVNKPFAQFETVVLNDGVDFTDIDNKSDNVEKVESTDEIVDSLNENATSEVEKAESKEEINHKITEEKPVEAVQEPVIEAPAVAVEPKEEVVEVPQVEKQEVVEEKETVVEEQAEAVQELPTAIAEIPEAIVEIPEVVAEQPNSNDEELPKANIEPVESAMEEITDTKTEQPVPEVKEVPKATIEVTESISTKHQEVTEPTERPKKTNWLLWSAIGFAIITIMYFFGYKFGKDAALSDNKLAVRTQTENSTAKKIKKAAQKPVVKAQKPAVKEVDSATEEINRFKQMSSDKRIRYGAYDIIGIEKVVVLKKGQTMQSYSRKALGPDMVAYFQVLNNATTMTAGDTMKVPKVELRPEYRTR